MRKAYSLAGLMGTLAALALAAAEPAADPPPAEPPPSIRLAKGRHPVAADMSFAGPVIAEEGAVLDIAEGVTLTFRNGLTAGRTRVFSGRGSVRGLSRLRPEWFGAAGDGVTDDTEALQKTFDSCEDRGFGPGSAGAGTVVELSGACRVSSVTVHSTCVTLHGENAWLVAMETGSYPYLLRFTHHFCRITGGLSIEGNYNLGYGCMIQVNTRHFTSHDVVIWRAGLGWLFGNRDWAAGAVPGQAELGDSEILIFGGATVHCLRGVEAVGANTIVLFSNALIYSYPWTLPQTDPRKAAWEAADATLVRCIGSLVYFTGGGLVNFSFQHPLIEVQPIRCTKPEYDSGYGGVFVSNAHIESGYLFATGNPHDITMNEAYEGDRTRQNRNSLVMTSCGGYITGRKNNPLITTDPLFTGGVVVQHCNFYGIRRTGDVARIGNPLARVRIDESSIHDDREPGLDAVAGGTRSFGFRVVYEARGSSQTIGPEGAAVRYASPALTSDTAAFQACYDARTGEFTVPPGGLRNVQVLAGTFSPDGLETDTVTLSVLRNGKPVARNRCAGNTASVTAVFAALEAGETIAVRQTTSPAARTLAGEDLNYVQVLGSRY